MKALIMAALLLAGCDNLSGGKAIQPDVTARATREPVLMIPNWQLRDKIVDFCGAGRLACTDRYLANGQWTAIVTAVEPTDFNDFNTTETLGHECWHGFGARHK